MKCKASSSNTTFKMQVHGFDLLMIFLFFCIFVNEKGKNCHVRLQLFSGESKRSLTIDNRRIIALD
jgi:hypothetical protein